MSVIDYKGRVKMNVLPFSSLLWTSIRMLWREAMLAAIASPNPLPEALLGSLMR